MNTVNKHMIDDLIAKYMAGEASETERLQAEQWINASDKNRKHFDDHKLIWHESERMHLDRNINEDAAWLRLQSRINLVHGGRQEKKTRSLKLQPIRVAASILLVSLIGYLVYNRVYNNHLINKMSGKMVLTENLADGSVVMLNSNSQLSYPEHFTGNQRLVRLKGEAFFKVAPNKTKPFIISVRNATISVVGTSFDIKDRNGVTEVIVATGIVKVKANQKEIQLYPGEKVEITETNTELIKKQNKGSLYNYYITGALVCDQTPLYQLVDKLNEIYPAHVEISNAKLRALPVTVTFKGQSLNEILRVIAETFDATIEHQGNRYLLK